MHQIGIAIKFWDMTGIRGGNVVTGAVTMTVITLVLFFMPLVNGIIGGAVGGYIVGDWRRALFAAVLPAIVAAVGTWVIIGVFGAPVLGFLAAAAVGVLVLLADIGMFIGALFGGMAAGAARREARVGREV